MPYYSDMLPEEQPGTPWVMEGRVQKTLEVLEYESRPAPTAEEKARNAAQRQAEIDAANDPEYAARNARANLYTRLALSIAAQKVQNPTNLADRLHQTAEAMCTPSFGAELVQAMQTIDAQANPQ